MITPQDLRLGNYVLVNKSVIRIQAIDENGINSDPNFGHYGDMNYDAHFDDGLFHRTEIKPVPLAVDIVEACGFEPQGTPNQYVFKEATLEHTTADDEWRLTAINGRRIELEPLRFLHQLQNVFFILTGRELDVKLSKKPYGRFQK